MTMAMAAALVLSWMAASGGGVVDHGRAPQRRVAKTQSCNVTHLAWCIDWSLPKPHVKYALSDAPNGSIANLQMSGNLSFLLASHAGLGLPGMLALQSREESQRHQPTNPPRPYIWESSPTGMRLGPDWEAAVALLARELTPLAPRTGTGALAGIMIGDEMVSAGFPLSNMSRLAARLHDTLAPLGIFIFTNEGGPSWSPCHTDADCKKKHDSGAGPATCQNRVCEPALWPEIPAGLDFIS